ncbi:hypothetical protein AXG93_2374s1020 [Marchantia polymorpha subsp. ruderalis]|uniref:Arf-GAP domain-containing protein n=1 Tax=Marchantia polymorpha subsp. ruderalis TaxID=1480154 RepID=A0A176WHK0_MARPO|nr:hypothetical protein AXG93_2374s1020 [Marchantia polymorpha subsp. ruderalis]
MDSAVMSAAAQYCADCKASRPRYANITLGIWLCNRCYGIHRNVGAHVTRTKCVGLDSWSTQELHRMKSIGNERAASYWESQVPDGYIRPSPKSTNEEVEKWIRDKYEKKLYCPRDSPPPSVPELPFSLLNSAALIVAISQSIVQEKPTSSTPHRYKQEQGVNFNIPLPRMKVIPTSSESGVGGDEDEFGNFMQAPS